MSLAEACRDAASDNFAEAAVLCTLIICTTFVIILLLKD